MVVARGGSRVVKAAPILVCCRVAGPSNAQSDTQPAFGSTANVPFQRWTWNRVIPAFTVPAATGGDGTLTYTATGLPAGVAMAASRRVAGTPTGARSQLGIAIVTVRDADGDTDTLSFGWTVAPPYSDEQPVPEPNPLDRAPDFGTAAVSAKTWTRGQAIPTFTVPRARDGDGTLSYRASGLPAGVRMSSTRRVSGTPTTSGTGTATVTARDRDGDTATLTFTWTVQASAPVTPPPIPSYQFILPSGTSRSGAFTVYWGSSSGATSYELQERMDSGAWSVVHTGTIRRLSRSKEINGVYAYRVRACKETACSDWTAIDSVTVAIPDAMPTYAGTIVTAKTWIRGQAITAFTVPAATGGDAPLSYSAASLPAGVTMSSTRLVSGTPTTSGTGTATVTTRDTDGDTAALTFTWTVEAPAPVTTPPVPSYQFILPSGTSRSGAFTVYWGSSSGATSYELQERMDSGAWSVVHTGTIRRLSRSKEINGVYAYRVRACKETACSDWTAIDSVTVAIPDRTPTYAGTIVTAKTWIQGQTITAFTVPAATGGDGTLTYRASGLPTGVTMSATREISGTPTRAGSGAATVTARDADGDTATLTFTWTVEADTTPSFGTTTVPDQNWVTDKAIAAFTVPAASGGNAPLMHAIRGLPVGVMMMESREITGTPTTAGSGTATVAARDADGDAAAVSFNWTVTANAVPSYGTASVASQNWTAGQTITAFAVPSASGGNGTLSYGASGLPEGVILSPSLQLSGRPLKTGSGTAVITARDADGDTATLRFAWTVASPNPANTGTVLSVNPNPTTTSDYTVVVTYDGARAYQSFTLTETDPRRRTRERGSLTGSFLHTVTNRANGVYTYRLEACTYETPSRLGETIKICEPVGDPLQVVVNGPDPDPVATQLGYTYQARKGDINRDGRMDLFIDRTSTGVGAGIFDDVILQQTASGAFELVAPSAIQAATASGWPTATVGLVLKDVNLDGFVDVLVRGLGSVITGALDQIVYAPGRYGGSPVILNAVDTSFRNFLTEVSGWAANPTTYFEQYRRVQSVPNVRYVVKCLNIGFGNSGDADIPGPGAPGSATRTYCYWKREVAGYTTHVYYVNSSSAARRFASQFSLVDGRIDPSVRVGSNSARELSRIFEDAFGIEVLNGRLERSCTGFFNYDSYASIACNDEVQIGFLLMQTATSTPKQIGIESPRIESISLTEDQKLILAEGNGLEFSEDDALDKVTIMNAGDSILPNSAPGCWVYGIEPYNIHCSDSVYEGGFDSLGGSGLLLHELTHVWQFVERRPLGSLSPWQVNNGEPIEEHKYTYRNPATGELAHSNFEEFALEQQAEIMRDRFLACDKDIDGDGNADRSIESNVNNRRSRSYDQIFSDLNGLSDIPPTTCNSQ